MAGELRTRRKTNPWNRERRWHRDFFLVVQFPLRLVHMPGPPIHQFLWMRISRGVR
jgi:hypothetical protein